MNNIQRKQRHRKIRAKVAGTATRPRVSVYRSNSKLIVQLIDDSKQVTIAQANEKNPKKAAADLAKKAKAAKINTVVYDRGGYAYHGRIKQLAESLREEGIKI